jgi:putative ABC transport system permease protein
MRGITGDYFAALGARLAAGRFFTAADRVDSQPVAIVNESFARRYFGGRDPLTVRVREMGSDEWRTVVGVIADVRHSGPAEDARPEVSLPYAQLEPGFMSTWSRGVYFVVRGALPASALTASARAQVAALDPDMSLNDVQSMAALAADAVSEPRFRTVLLGTFAGLAITLASIGVFGVLSYFVTQRTREIGIRVALGASSRDILRMIVGRGLLLAAVGLVIGLLAAIPLTRSMQSLLFEVKPLDIPTLVVVIVGLAAIAGLASYLPARRALRIEPMTALHLE